MHLMSLEIENLRVFRKVALSFAPVDVKQPFSNVHLFLGINGSGKTSLLRAIALAAIGAVLPSSGMRPYSLVRRVGSRRPPCTVTAQFSLGPQDGGASSFSSVMRLEATTGFNDKFGTLGYPKAMEKVLWDDSSPAAFIVGYGAQRLPEPESAASSRGERSRNLRYLRVAGLFEEYVPLKPLRAWLPAFAAKNKGRHTQVVSLVNKLLADVDVALLAKPVDGEYLFEMGSSQLPLSALSDGYRAYIGWISDLIHHVCMGCPPGKQLWESQGIVLIDEIDLHLHPQWQRVVIERLSRTLPNLQFFFTTHSPLIAGSVPAAHVHVVDGVDASKGAQVVPSPVDAYGWSADQILNSALFAKTPPRNQHAVDVIKKASVKARSGDRAAAMDLMSVLADGIAGSTPQA
jgi:hypothetical protein